MKNNISKTGWPVITLLIITTLLLAGCGSKPSTTVAPVVTTAPAVPTSTTAALLKVCLFTSSSINDMGWSYANEQGRLYMMDKVKGVTSTMTDQISDTGGADVVKVIEDMITAQNCKVIIGTSFGYSDAITAEATKHPDIIFMNESDYGSGPNIQSHWSRYYDGMYLTGALAGLMTKSNKIGWVAGFPIPEYAREINAFYRGMKLVNPNAEVQVVWTGSWYDPAKETEATNGLIASGADIIQHAVSDPAPIQAAEAAGVKSIGFQIDQCSFGPNNCLTSMMINWGPIYASSVQKVIDGTWKPGEIWFGLKEGVAELAPFGPAVPADVKAKIADLQAKIVSGEIQIFEGPIVDQSGTERLPAGQLLGIEDIKNMDYFFQGINGTMAMP